MATTPRYTPIGKKGENIVRLKDTTTGKEKLVGANSALAQKYAPKLAQFKPEEDKLTKPTIKGANVVFISGNNGKEVVVPRDSILVRSHPEAKRYALESDKINSLKDTLKRKAEAKAKRAAEQKASADKTRQNKLEDDKKPSSGFSGGEVVTSGPNAGKVKFINNASGKEVFFERSSGIVKRNAPDLFQGDDPDRGSDASGKTPEQRFGSLADAALKSGDVSSQQVQAAFEAFKNGTINEKQLEAYFNQFAGGAEGDGDQTTVPGDKDGEIGDGSDPIGDAVQNGEISSEIADIYRDLVDQWEAGKEVTLKQVLSDFEKLKRDTIDPVFREKVDVLQREFQDALEINEEARRLELEAEDTNLSRDFENTQKNLAASGLFKSSEAGKELGRNTLFGGVVPFGGDPGEGRVFQRGRLIADTSRLRQKEKLGSLGRQAEGILGSEGAKGLGISGFNPLGGIKGSLAAEKELVELQSLERLQNQAARQNQFNRPLSFNF